MILGLIIFGGLYALLNNDSEKKPEDYGLRSPSSIQAEIESSQKRREESLRIKNSSGKGGRYYREAQSAYIRGSRDFREGNFNGAIQSFTAALALYPKHENAQRYKNLAARKRDELVQNLLFEGNRLMDRGRYREALSIKLNLKMFVVY